MLKRNGVRLFHWPWQIVLLTMGLSISARAVTLSPGGAVLTSGTSTNLRPELVANLLTNLTESFVGVSTSGTITFTGSLRLEVRQEVVAGTLDFYFQIINDPTSLNSIARLTTASYTRFLTDVDWRTDRPGSIAVTSADRQALGDAVGFNFTSTPLGAGVISPGSTSHWFFVKTDATQFGLGTVALIDGGVATVAAFAPIPEPSTSVLVIGALCSVGALLRANGKRLRAERWHTPVPSRCGD
jgi:hypothetical protein